MIFCSFLLFVETMGKGKSGKQEVAKATKPTKPNRPVPAAKKAKEEKAAKEAKAAEEAAKKQKEAAAQAIKEAAAKKKKEAAPAASKKQKKKAARNTVNAESDHEGDDASADPTAVNTDEQKKKSSKGKKEKAKKAAAPAKVAKVAKPRKQATPRKVTPKKVKEVEPGINPATGRPTPTKVNINDVSVVYDAVQARKARVEQARARNSPLYEPRYKEYSNVSQKKVQYFDRMKAIIDDRMAEGGDSYIVFEPYPNHHLVGPTLAPFSEYCKQKNLVTNRKRATELQLRVLGYKTKTLPAGPRFFTVVARDREVLGAVLNNCGAVDSLAGLHEAEVTRGNNKPPRKWAAKYWSKDDAEALVEAYERLGSWSKIKGHPDYQERFADRTEVNLKDKYRNLHKAAVRVGGGPGDGENYTV